MSEYTDNLIAEAAGRLKAQLDRIPDSDAITASKEDVRAVLAALDAVQPDVATSAPIVVMSSERGKPVAVQPVTPDPERPFSSSEPDHETVCGCGATGNGCCKPVTPDREAIARVAAGVILRTRGNADGSDFADALLPLLGQPRTDAPKGGSQ